MANHLLTNLDHALESLVDHAMALTCPTLAPCLQVMLPGSSPLLSAVSWFIISCSTLGLFFLYKTTTADPGAQASGHMACVLLRAYQTIPHGWHTVGMCAHAFL